MPFLILYTAESVQRWYNDPPPPPKAIVRADQWRLSTSLHTTITWAMLPAAGGTWKQGAEGNERQLGAVGEALRSRPHNDRPPAVTNDFDKQQRGTQQTWHWTTVVPDTTPPPPFCQQKPAPPPGSAGPRSEGAL